jgi:hypothetical protein
MAPLVVLQIKRCGETRTLYTWGNPFGFVAYLGRVASA